MTDTVIIYKGIGVVPGAIELSGDPADTIRGDGTCSPPAGLVSGVTTITIGALVSGEWLKLVGTEIVTAAIAGGGDMLKSENLSGLADYPTARTNLGLGTAAVTNATAYATAAQGATADAAQPAGSYATGAQGSLADSALQSIAAGSITLAMQANMASASLVYRKTGAAGAPEVNTLATVKTDLGLTGTNSGDQASIVGISGTLAEFNTALSDANFASGGGTATGTNTGDNATNSQYSGLVSNATHTGDATGSTALTVVKIQGKDFPALGAGDDQKYPKYVSASSAFVMTAIAGGGDTIAPATNSADFLPQWNGANSKTLKDGLAVPAGGLAGLTALAAKAPLAAPVFTAGSASAGTWPKLSAGTVLTTPEVGALELDANCLYSATDAGNRGYIPVRHFIRCNAERTLPNDSNLNAIFNNPTNGRLTLETGTYLFDMVIGINGMSATSGNAMLDVLGAGTAVVDDWLYGVLGKDATLISVAAVLGVMPVINSTPASMFTAGTGAEMWWISKGSFTVTTGGTLIPSIDQVTGAAAVVQIGSYFSCERIGGTAVVSVGQWD